jgi:enamine deaminase RidA (YjgF/YER057c/UK114 family)
MSAWPGGGFAGRIWRARVPPVGETMIERLDEEARLSGAVIHGGTVYLAGQVADDVTGDAEAQTADILRQIDALLAKAGTDKTHLLTVQIFLADLEDFPALNRAWDAWLDPAHKPARATVQAKLADPAWRVEITGIAALPAIFPRPRTDTLDI